MWRNRKNEKVKLPCGIDYLRVMSNAPLAHYVQAYDRYLEEFIDTFSAFAKTEYNAPIAAGKWSPGQMVDHLIKAERGTLRLLSGPPEGFEATDRPADEKCAAMDANFKLTTTPLPAPARLHPSAEAKYSPGDQLDEFVDQRADILSAVDFADDPGRVVLGWNHPMFGHMTMLEWLYLTAIHGERHRLQVAASRR